mgnify:CR=1 FL=1
MQVQREYLAWIVVWIIFKRCNLFTPVFTKSKMKRCLRPPKLKTVRPTCVFKERTLKSLCNNCELNCVCLYVISIFCSDMYTNVHILYNIPFKDDELDQEKDTVDGRMEPVEECMDISIQLINRLAQMDYSGYSMVLILYWIQTTPLQPIVCWIYRAYQHVVGSVVGIMFYPTRFFTSIHCRAQNNCQSPVN